MMYELLSDEGKMHVYTDRRMLLSQLSENMSLHGISHGLIAAGHETSIADKQLCMSQTVYTRHIQKHRILPKASILMWDEVHKQSGNSSLLTRDAYGASVDIGFTATPLGLGHCYDELIVAASNSELRHCGSLVPAIHYAPDEPSVELVTGQRSKTEDPSLIPIGSGECAIPSEQRAKFAKVIYGRVLDNYLRINPSQRPTILFAPGVAESIYFARELSKSGIPTAHIDGKNAWLDGELIPKTQEVVDEIKERLRSGDIKIVSNRFVLREGIDWPFVSHGIFATVFGSLTSYLQAGGRMLRAYPDKPACTIQDHGGSWHRHGSLNEDRIWNLEYTDRIVASIRQEKLRSNELPEPIVCYKCGACRRDGNTCHKCGYTSAGRHRMVLQVDGTLKRLSNKIYKERRRLQGSEAIEAEWMRRVRAVRKSSRPSMETRTFAQLEVSFARDHNWAYPPRDIRGMPKDPIDFYRPVKDVPPNRLKG
jgi:superfamily II DNA or RNA helicase